VDKRGLERGLGLHPKRGPVITCLERDKQGAGVKGETLSLLG
jgi:hypothetical protein